VIIITSVSLVAEKLDNVLRSLEFFKQVADRRGRDIVQRLEGATKHLKNVSFRFAVPRPMHPVDGRRHMCAEKFVESALRQAVDKRLIPITNKSVMRT
jgi:hypothetical protein